MERHSPSIEAADTARGMRPCATPREALARLTGAFADPASPLRAADPLVIAPGSGTAAQRAPHVLVSAPHSVPHERGDRLLPPECETGALAVQLSRTIGCGAICKTSPRGDANWDAESPYRDLVCDIVREHRIRALVDLHQMRSERPQSFEVGSGHGENVLGRRDLVRAVAGALGAADLGPIVTDGLFSASKPATVSATVSRRCRIPCIQIEINSGLVADGDRFERVLTALEGIAVLLERMTA